VEFNDSHLIDTVQSAIGRARIRPDQLKIEITETECMEDPTAAAERMRQIQNLGVEVLIDDFGTGQSSLGYLRSLPASALKLDKSLVRDLETREEEREFLRHLVSAIKSRIPKVVIEGVEAAGQAWHARTLSCDLMQGSFFGWAVPPREFEELLARNAAAAEATAAEAPGAEAPPGM
jgi:EAL domain-containing protein (putative c-di-GMP-specific phosphodiesterase class I)